jgi:protein tyrosine phosphatase (PTP) superfamily phosphohydrolase (DUF442 family)
MPAGIPGFTPVKTDVATGFRPLIEGLDWLKDKGYRAVFFLRQPGEEDTADRTQFESTRGLKYLTLVVSPKNLTAEVVNEFNRIVGDSASRPLFVYASNETLLSGMWYLHFRTVDGLSDEEAQRKAAPLGLKPNSDKQREMWLAIQKYLSENRP